MFLKIRKRVLLCSFAPLPLAVICDNEDEELAPLVYNDVVITLSEGPDFSTNDTLWISGTVSSLVFDEAIQDSIRNPNERITTIFSVLQLQNASNISNTTEAISEFDIVTRRGGYDFLGVCPESELIAIAPLTQNGDRYTFEIGIVSRTTGDFVLSWLEPVVLSNPDLNFEILEKYPLEKNTNTLGLTKCGITSTRDNVSGARREYFFSVTDQRSTQ
ncbi:MAG: hypothetical protein AAGF96_09945 [Bacteroidota bacterium]